MQCDLPESVYHAPATAFVARFTGIAGELRGRISGPRDSEGRYPVETPDGPLIATGQASEPMSSGTTVDVLVRPAAVRLDTADDGDGDGDSNGNGNGNGNGGLPSRVQHAAYRGHGYDHVVELADGTPLAGVFAAHRCPRGSEVRVHLDPGGCFVYRSDADA